MDRGTIWSLAADELHRLDQQVYDGQLPAIGLEVVGGLDAQAVTRYAIYEDAAGDRYVRVDGIELGARLATRGAVLEAIRHEVAHVAAMWLDGELGHGPAWREHARRCGARSEPCLDPLAGTDPFVLGILLGMVGGLLGDGWA